jgi:hypothetical protein
MLSHTLPNNINILLIFCKNPQTVHYRSPLLNIAQCTYKQYINQNLTLTRQGMGIKGTDQRDLIGLKKRQSIGVRRSHSGVIIEVHLIFIASRTRWLIHCK